MIFDVSLGNGAADSDPRLMVETARAADELGFRALFHDTHHRAYTSPAELLRVPLHELP